MRVSGVYKSWEDVRPQVMGCEHNLHKGYKTREESEKAYFEFLSQ
jgi:viroplasmin and RNaseH domain-containing protein